MFTPSTAGTNHSPCGWMARALAGVLCAGIAVTAAAAQNRRESTGLSIGRTQLVPGTNSHIELLGPEGVALRSGRVVMRFSPQIFLDTPAIAFPDAPEGLWFGLTHLGPGRYAVEFEVPSEASALPAGSLFSMSAVLRPSLQSRGSIHVTLGGFIVTDAGAEVPVDLRRQNLPLVTDSYPITLHVADRNDLRPGGKVTVELYTYNPKLISDGQICLRFDAAVFATVESVAVQGEPDVSYVAGPEHPGELVVRFSSPSSSINRYEGAIVRIGMRVADGLPDGLETVVEVDSEESFLRDYSGELVNLESESGIFRVGNGYGGSD